MDAAAPPRTGTIAVVAATLFLDMLLYGLVVPVVPAYGTTLGATPREIGALFASYAVALLVATPPLGALSARIGRRAPLLAGLLGLALSTALFSAATSLTALVVARALQGVSAAASWTAGLALIADAAPEHRRGGAFGVSTTASSLGTLLGPPAGGWLADAFGYRAPFRIMAGLTALVFVAALVVLGRGRMPAVAPSRGPGVLLRDGEARTAFAFVALGAAVLGVLEPLMPLHMAARLGASPGAIGLYFTAATIGYAVAAPLAGRLADRHGAAPQLRGGWIALVVLLPALAIPTTAAGAVAAMALIGVALAFVLTPTLPALAACADRVGGDYAVAYAGYNGAYAVGVGLGAMVGGPIAGAVGIGAALGAVAGGVLVAGGWPAWRVGRTRG
jgi:multidrug resistance protein